MSVAFTDAGKLEIRKDVKRYLREQKLTGELSYTPSSDHIRMTFESVATSLISLHLDAKEAHITVSIYQEGLRKLRHVHRYLAAQQIVTKILLSGLPLEVWCSGQLDTFGGEDNRRPDRQRKV